ncbi:hypothetical protein [Micromonospora cathayae]|uniref:Uncharacterized protein n=1 Tax=Micromonospora cathayae TaxID=3028804 RepID=A0ABY7ZXM5_9ACTN|nr:hypothetical protein [Micromonospora sp. HUAS 3]WDZ87198.1 hypothetical protein PVK37_12720 [Micromonospora sp. HUAS 3]
MINPNVVGRGNLVALINAELSSAWDRMNTMVAQIEQLARVTITSGQADVPAMALGAVRQIVVTLRTPMPDATYSATPALSGGANLLSTVVADGITAQTATTVTVQVRATGILSAGAVVTVHAVRHS